MSNSACYTIDDVMRLTGVSRRTVRYYVTRELIPPPDGRGVGLHYRQEHVDGVLRVLEAKERGASLASIAGAEHERSQRTFAEQDGGTPNPSVAVDHGGPKGEAAMSKDPSSGNAKAATPDARLARIRVLMQLGRCAVESRTGTNLVISDGKGMGEALILQPGGRAEVEAVTLSLAKAEMQGLVAVTPV